VQENDRPKTNTIFLIGYRATGKSTVGKLVADRLDAHFLDTDRAIEAKIKMTIAECFARHGESRFRDLEGEALEEIAVRSTAGDSLVVGTGGGMIIRPAHVDRMRQLGTVIWLSARPEILRERLTADASTTESRPGLTGGSAIDEVETVLLERTPIYRKAADLELSCDPPRTPDEIADEVVEWLRRNG
jgi:shikimate kinase